MEKGASLHRNVGGTMWLDELTESELEVMRVTLKTSIYSQDLNASKKQDALHLLNEIEDYLWNSVCRNSPADSDQLQTSR